eukprot:scaffold1972_cov265-Chaetoceros_neogracile.AAC.49
MEPKGQDDVVVLQATNQPTIPVIKWCSEGILPKFDSSNLATRTPGRQLEPQIPFRQNKRQIMTKHSKTLCAAL